MKNLRLTAVAFVVGLSSLTGCSSGLNTVNLQGSASVAASSVQVDVVGLNANNQTLKAIPVPQYWRGASAPYKADIKSFRFGPNSPQTYTIAASDPIWQHWKSTGATEVMVDCRPARRVRGPARRRRPAAQDHPDQVQDPERNRRGGQDGPGALDALSRKAETRMPRVKRNPLALTIFHSTFVSGGASSRRPEEGVAVAPDFVTQ